MHEDQALPSYVNQRVLALHRYAIALKQGDLDGVAAVLHAAEQDHALGKMIQEFNAIAQEDNHLMISPQSISHVQELLHTYRSAHSPNEQTPAEVILPTDPTTDRSGREKQTTHSTGERLVGATTRRQRLTSLAHAVAAVLIVGSLLGSFLVLFASHPLELGRGTIQLRGPQEEILVLATTGGFVSALRASDHAVLWQRSIGNEIMEVVMQQQIVYVATFTRGGLDIYALNARDGEVNWHRSLGERLNIRTGGLVVDDGLVILSDTHIYALDARTGRDLQLYPDYRPASSGEWLLTAHNGIIYAADQDKYGKASLVAFQARDKKLLWQYEFPAYIAPESVSVVNDIVYVRTGGVGPPNYLAALHNEHGSVLWLRKLTNEGPTLNLFAVEHDVIYFYGFYPHLHFCAYRAHDGSQLYCRPTSVPPDTLIGATGSFYTGFIDDCPPYDPHAACQPRDPRDRSLYEIEARDAMSVQAVRWHWSSAPTTYSSRMFLSVVADQLYVATGEGIYALRVRDGFQRWHVEDPGIVAFTAGSLDQ